MKNIVSFLFLLAIIEIYSFKINDTISIISTGLSIWLFIYSLLEYIESKSKKDLISVNVNIKEDVGNEADVEDEDYFVKPLDNKKENEFLKNDIVNKVKEEDLPKYKTHELEDLIKILLVHERYEMVSLIEKEIQKRKNLN